MRRQAYSTPNISSRVPVRIQSPAEKASSRENFNYTRVRGVKTKEIRGEPDSFLSSTLPSKIRLNSKNKNNTSKDTSFFFRFVVTAINSSRVIIISQTRGSK